ncbi:MAG TPA: heme biosynthesis HemY N-terminal domain-containing protein [Gammaproteobacteria bacterium]|jgi:HemY protein
MRFAFWLLAAIFLGAFLAHFLLEDRGYVLITFAGYDVEMSVPALIVVLFVAYFGIRAIAAFWRAPRRLGEAVAEARLRRAGNKLTRGLIHVAEGDWHKGERLLSQGLKGTDSPLINYLLAARAAQLQGSNERRDDWLKLAYEDLPEAETAILLTQAELQLEHSEFERALATLSRIEEAHPGHPLASALLVRVHGALKDWDRVLALLPRLQHGRIDASTIAKLAAAALEHYVARPNLSHEALEQLWVSLPQRLRREPALLAIHATSLSGLGHGDSAEKAVRNALKIQWQEDLVIAYGHVKSADPGRQLKRAEQWLKAHPEDAALLLTVARLCMKAQLWGKARSYLESSLAISPRTDAYALYGQLLKELGEEDEAASAFRSGLALVTPGLNDLPALGAPRTPMRSDDDVSEAGTVESRATR